MKKSIRTELDKYHINKPAHRPGCRHFGGTEECDRNKKGECKKHARYRAAAKTYGLTFYQLLDMLDKQKHLCALCGDPLTGRIHIDHDHKTSRVRGVLHARCNVALGLFQDSWRQLWRAAQYIKNTKRQDFLKGFHW